MVTTIAQLPSIPASTDSPSPSLMDWTAEALTLIGFKPEDAKYFGLPAYSAYALETAMGAIGVAAILEASAPWTP
jgi:hypothetical protein